MTISDPPQVEIGASAWLDTEWDVDTPSDFVQHQPAEIPLGSARYVRWTVWEAATVPIPRVCMLKLATVGAPTQQALGAALTDMPVGKYATRLRILTAGEAVVLPADPITVVP